MVSKAMTDKITQTYRNGWRSWDRRAKSLGSLSSLTSDNIDKLFRSSGITTDYLPYTCTLTENQSTRTFLLLNDRQRAFVEISGYSGSINEWYFSQFI